MGCSGCALGTDRNPGGNYVGVRLADAEDGKTTIVFSGEVHLQRGERVIIETDTGPEFAEVMTTNPLLAKPCSSKKARRFLRLASDSEYADYVDRLEVQDKAFTMASHLVAERRLELHLVKCVLPFDRRKLTVLYTADKKVETRDLARELSTALQLRVETRMIGVRDETKLLGGIGSCGLTLCCSTWLKGFHPVTIRMAKLQGISPNPAKLTGNCGRLKCCVAYELEGGIEAARRMGSGGDRGERPAPAAAA
jgi:cell fate regulator YaaT (PSP1 superfamily)